MNDGVALPSPAPDVRNALDAAGTKPASERIRELQEVVRVDPLCLEGWGLLGQVAYETGDDIAAYAYSRVGYHRGLDQLRSVGWRPDREARADREGNGGFLLALYGLMKAAAAIGEGAEARRCREFLIQLDPSDPFDVGRIAPKDLSRRLDG